MPAHTPTKRRRILRGLGLTTLLLLSLLTLSLWAVGELLTRPARQTIGSPPQDLAAENVNIHNASGEVHGWLIRGQAHAGAVLLLHGVRSNRLQMLGRARLLAHAGYTVLLIDLPAHGESSGERISFGWNERLGVRAALAYLRQQAPGSRIGVIGVSLGAASTVLAQAEPAPDAVVLESMYTDIRSAIAHRLRLHLGPLGPKLAPALIWQIPLRLHIQPEQLQPLALMPRWHVPLLIANGSQDQHATATEAQQLFAAAAGPKQLWMVAGARHVDLQAYNPQAYQAHILPFLAAYLRPNRLRSSPQAQQQPKLTHQKTLPSS